MILEVTRPSSIEVAECVIDPELVAAIETGSSPLTLRETDVLCAAESGVSIPTDGTLVTSQALGIAIGGPILTALTIKLKKRPS